MEKRVSEQVANMLLNQYGMELDSAYIYLGMASWCEYHGYFNSTEFFKQHYQEELKHAMKIFDYLQDRCVMTVIPDVTKPPMGFTDFFAVFNKALEHEKNVSKAWALIATISLKEGDHATYRFSDWFVNEQVEEERLFMDIVTRGEQLKACMKKEYLLDTEVIKSYIK